MDSESENEETISLIPGTGLSVVSGFRDIACNELSKKILRIALTICAIQVIITLVVFSLLMAEDESPWAAIRLIDLVGVSVVLLLVRHTHELVL